MSQTACAETIVESIEATSEPYDATQSDDDLLAEALDRIERATPSLPRDAEDEEYEIHRIAEASATPPPQTRSQPWTAFTQRRDTPDHGRGVNNSTTSTPLPRHPKRWSVRHSRAVRADALPPVAVQYDGIFEDIFDDAFTGSEPGWLRAGTDALTDSQRLVPREGSPGHGLAPNLAIVDETRGAVTPPPAETAKAESKENDTRSPLQRFRAPPKKPLSVTDLISPAWCELQYWYSLIHFGRKRRTPAMKRGSIVHKTLEEQVHVTVPVDVQTREDTWGLRIWNTIQGLRTLRVTGMTRELEVWGVVEGEVVNGIIDELSYACPDPMLEAQLSAPQSANGNKKKHDIEIAADQATLEEFFTAPTSHSSASSVGREEKENAKIYLTDVKTRNSRYPPKGVSLRPTHLQLMAYRKLLATIADDKVDRTVVFKRYNLDPDAEFSTQLVQQLASVGDSLTDAEPGDGDSNEATSYAPVKSDEETAVELLEHNTLNRMWTLMLQEFAQTMGLGGESISKVLQVEYRSSGDGTVMAARTFEYQDTVVEEYVAEEMRWWRGERAAQGVPVEEAFKCQICEFAAGCEWRKGKIEEAVGRHRGRNTAGEVKSENGAG